MIVKTISGENISKELCRRIDGQYYKIGSVTSKNSGDCYLIGSIHYIPSRGKIMFDDALGEYLVVADHTWFKDVIISFNKDLSFNIGTTTKPIIKSYLTLKSTLISTTTGRKNVDYGTPMRGGYIRFNSVIDPHKLEGGDPLRSVFVKPSVLATTKIKSFPSSDFSSLVLRNLLIMKSDIHPSVFKFSSGSSELINGMTVRDYKNRLLYTMSSRLMSSLSASRNEHYNNSKLPKEPDNFQMYSNIVDGLTYGFELETTSGIISPSTCEKLGVTPLRDGSVPGLEYVTVPYSGSNPLRMSDSIIKTAQELTNKCEFDDSCSLHLHIGGMPRTEKFIVAFVKMLPYYEDIMYSLLPSYKKYNKGVKRKNYTKAFPHTFFNVADTNSSTVNDSFNIIRNILTCEPNDRSKVKIEDIHHHPSDPEGTRKWQVTSRYFGVNLIPLIFGNKKTIEFRSHDGTFDPERIMLWQTLCSLFIKHTIRFQDDILSGDYFSKMTENISARTLINTDYTENSFNAEFITFMCREQGLSNHMNFNNYIRSLMGDLSTPYFCRIKKVVKPFSKSMKDWSISSFSRANASLSGHNRRHLRSSNAFPGLSVDLSHEI